MSAIKKIIDAGRDPLEALLIPSAPDVAAWLAEDETERIDELIRREIAQWSPEMRQRLRDLVERRPQQ